MQTSETRVNNNESGPATNYDLFAQFYDAVMGNRERAAGQVASFISEFHPTAKTVLELAAGTGTNLVPLSEKYEVSGLDLSAGMLAVAKTKLPAATFYEQSMVDFKIPKTFDVILCLFDSINHLVNFSDWRKMFESAASHLNHDGILIFDVNTPEKLQRVLNDKPFVKNIDGVKMEITVEDAGNSITNWKVKFTNQDGVTVGEENISEVAFPTEQIRDTLAVIFSSVEVRPAAKKENGIIERVYFICRK